MNIALFGYGKMGQVIEKIALDKNHKIVLITEKGTDLKKIIDIDNLAIEVAIEFSVPKAAFENIEFCLENNITVISGTTGWLDRLPEIEKLTILYKGTFFYASNFSLGVNVFFNLNKHLAKLLTKYNYTPEIEETHHIHKKDAPSGTAITLAKDIIKENSDLSTWVNKITNNPNELVIKSKREEEITGTHKVMYKGNNDEIVIEHKATNRLGFALGALAVAEWIKDKQGVLTMVDFMDN